MHSTFFAGLTELEPWEPISTDGSAIQARNPSITDHFLKIGVVTHRHDAHAALADPVVAPSAAVVSSGGAIPAGLTIELGVTVTDADAGETLLSPTVSVATGGGLSRPESAPVVEADYTGGTLRTDTYFYGVTLLDGGGGETSIGPMAQVTREPGYASGQVQVSGLFDLIDGTEAVAWKLYRATGGSDWAYIASGVEDTFTDTGGICADCSAQPPREGTNTTGQTSLLQVTLPSFPSGAVDYLVYATLDGSFSAPSLLGSYPVASAGAVVEYPTLDFLDGRPPLVSTCVPGASKIDPDTDLLDWHWKRPVASAAALPVDAEEGDVRVTLDDGQVHVYVGGAWAGGGGGGGGSAFFGDPVADETALNALTPQPGEIRLTLDTGKLWHYNDGLGMWLSVGLRSISSPNDGTFVDTSIGELSFQGIGGLLVSVSAYGNDGAQINVGPEGRLTQLRTAAGLASGADADYLMPFGAGYRLLKVEASQAARIRVYAEAADRTADAGRAIGVAPAGDHGVMFEQVLSGAMLSKRLTPPVEGADHDLADGVPIRVTNLGATADLTVTFLYVRTE